MFFNRIKVVVLFGLLTYIIVQFGSYIAGPSGVLYSIIFIGIINFFSYFYSDKLILKFYGAKEVGEDTQLYKIVEKIAKKADLPMPKVCIVNENQPNAFATGRNHKHSAVVVTTGLLRILDENEISGVVAHELGHIHNYDILISSIVGVMAGAINLLVNVGKWRVLFGGSSRDEENSNAGAILAIVGIVLVPVITLLIRLAISRSREYQADLFGAKMSSPKYLASALRKLNSYDGEMEHIIPETSNMFIVNPFSSELFSTHPSIEKRIKILEDMVN